MSYTKLIIHFVQFHLKLYSTINGGEGWNIGWTTPDTLQTIVNDLKYVNENYSIASVNCYYKDYSVKLQMELDKMNN